MRFDSFRDNPQFGMWYGRVSRQPGWVVKAAVMSAVMVVVVPVVVLTVAALVVGTVVFFVLGLIASLFSALGSLGRGGAGVPEPTWREDGRVNVRVIETDRDVR